MKHILTATIIAGAIFTVQAAEKTFPEKVRNAAEKVAEKTRDAALDTKDAIVGTAHRVGRATRAAWFKTKAYASDDVPVYQEGAAATLAGLGTEIAELRARTPSAAPAYFRTRLLSLKEQHEHLAMRLGQLTRDELRERSIGPRYDFDRCVVDLEQAIDQALDGADMLAHIALK